MIAALVFTTMRGEMAAAVVVVVLIALMVPTGVACTAGRQHRWLGLMREEAGQLATGVAARCTGLRRRHLHQGDL